MQRNRELLKLAGRVLQGCSHGSSMPGATAGQQLASLLEARPQPFVSLLQQQARLLAQRPGAASAQQLRQLATAARGAGVQARPLGHQLQGKAQQEQQWGRGRFDPLGLRRGVASEAVAKPRPQTRSRNLEGKRSLWSGLLLLAPGVLAGFLGKWQLDRRNWKLDLLRRRELMLTGEPLDLFEVEDCPPEYTRVRGAGVFDYGKTVYVGPRARSFMGKPEKGYLAVTPLYNPQLKRTVLVNRGWVPASWLEAEAEREKGEPKGTVAVEGVLRLGEEPGEFVPANAPEKREWYYLNAMQIAQHCGLPPDTPLMEVVAGERPTFREPTAMELLGGKRALVPKPVDEPPVAKSVEDFMHWSVMPSDHFNYAATWFTLSGLVSLMAVKAIRQGMRK